MVAPRKRSRDESQGAGETRSPRRVATVFDAVAGRVGYEAFLGEEKPSKNRDTKSSTSQAVPPDEVLFRRRGAPQRYEEYDPYFANERLRPDQKLPDSDLLKCIHAYASDFYRSSTSTRGKRDWKSMDETALLALGILLEETAAQSLGKTGDLALVEGDDADDGFGGATFWNGQTWTRSVLERPSGLQKTVGRAPRSSKDTVEEPDAR